MLKMQLIAWVYPIPSRLAMDTRLILLSFLLFYVSQSIVAVDRTLDNAGYLQKNIFHPCYLTYQSSENQLFCCYTIEHIISKGSPHDLSIIITIIIFG